MFLAVRDLAFAKGRFVLMATVIVMVALMMVLLTGLSSGLVDRNISGIRALPITHIAFEFDDKPTWSNSMVERTTWEGWAEQSGVNAAVPLGNTLFNARTSKGDPVNVALWGMEPGTFIDPGANIGQPIGNDPYGVVVSRMLVEDNNVEIGDTIVLDRVLTELKVVGIVNAHNNIAHTPVVYAPFRLWAEASYGPPGGALPGESLPDILYDFATVVALDLEETADVAAIDDAQFTVTLDKPMSFVASTGYTAERDSVRINQGFLLVISTLVIGAFFTVWTIQRTQEIGLIKALGASTGYLVGDALAQAFMLLTLACIAGVLVGYGLGTYIVDRTDIPYVIDINAMLISGGLVIGGGLVGAALAVRTIAGIDPIIALGQLR
ncbi:MAG: ABC transporter permease [Rhodospirillaceae bacterium]|jgi:putative ABC transport system permease protein|nr:ABC transporter permease [Rhodospirillaceae bacterium]